MAGIPLSSHEMAASGPPPDSVPPDPGGAQTSLSLYQAVGGEAFFFGLVDRFYDGVETDPVLRPLYPDDLTAARRHTALFLIQYWGGPSTYNEERGHPRLRMRHLPFAIGQPERDTWFRLMMDAVRTELSEAPASSLLAHPTEGDAVRSTVEGMFGDYFERASTAMINQPGT